VKRGTPYATLQHVSAIVSHKEKIEQRFRQEVIGDASGRAVVAMVAP